jgi:hypothetical protein
MMGAFLTEGADAQRKTGTNTPQMVRKTLCSLSRRPLPSFAPLRLCVMALAIFFFTSVLGGTSRAAAVGAPLIGALGPQPSEPLAFSPPALLPLEVGFPHDCWMLAEALNANHSEWLVNGLAVIGLLIGIAVGIQKLMGRKSPQATHLEGQPIGVTAQHPCVDHPTFDRHTDEIWKVVNGLRLALARIETVCGENKVLREANADRLIEVATKLDTTSDAVNRLIGGLEAYNIIPKQTKHGK